MTSASTPLSNNSRVWARELEEGDIPLEQALEVYERAVGLFRACRDRLTGVEAKLELLTRDLEGEPLTTPLVAPAETGDG